MAETLEVQTKRAGGRVVDCSGLENQAGKTPYEAELAEVRVAEAAQDAPFADCSVDSDGAKVGTGEQTPGIVPNREPRSVQRHRARQHRHALDRLRERYFPDAEQDDLIAIRDLAREKARAAKTIDGTDVCRVWVPYRGRLVHVVYSPRFRAVRTVMPCGVPA